MRETIVVSGAGGFLGSRFIHYLKTDHLSKYTVVPLYRFDLDLGSVVKIKKFLVDNSPSFFFHFVGRTCGGDLNDFVRDNVWTTRAILEAVRICRQKVRIFVPGSAAEYGTTNGLAVCENSKLSPTSLYGISKVWQSALSVYYSSLGVNVLVGRIFNILSKESPGTSAVGNFLRQINASENHMIHTLGLEAYRDYLDVYDVCNGIFSIATKGTVGEIYNICSGRMVCIRDLLRLMLACAGKNYQIKESIIACGNELLTADTSIGSNMKIRSHTGWQPRFSLEEAVSQLFK